MRIDYPFSAVVGEEDLKLALQLVAVDPTIGGVLIVGQRGTAKSTVARGLAALLPAKPAGDAAPFVELPLGATEDRVVGSLDVTKALREGQTQLRSGLMARADGGILYVDEVNLLPDHLVDLLLDAAARGWVTVERDGVSAGEAARFVLIGTMNPQEGELRPQLLDRFGLAVQMQGLTSPELRTTAVARRLAFDADPRGFVARARLEEDRLHQAVVEARARLHQVEVTSAHLTAVASLSLEQRLEGIRGDLAVIKTARALAAWQNAPQMLDEHIRRAADFALAHRAWQPPGAARRAYALPSHAATAAPGGTPALPATPSTSAPAPPAPLVGSVSLAIRADHDRMVSRRSDPTTTPSRRALRAEPYDHLGTLAVNETLTVAAMRGSRAPAVGAAVSRSDLMQHSRSSPNRNSVLLVVDASGSMAAQRRLQVAKGAALAMLKSARRHCDEVALMVFRGDGTDLVLPFTSEVERIESALRDVPTGGRTPLAQALLDCAQLLRERASTIVVLFTDGRANVALTGSGTADPWEQALAVCNSLATLCRGALVVDCETGPITLGRPRLLAEALQGEYISLLEVESSDLTIRLRRRVAR
jgi:magnesium chelatase subunit D